MVNFGLIPRFLSDILGALHWTKHVCFGPIFLFYLYIQSAEAYMGQQGCYERIAHTGKMKTKKGRKQWANSELS